jgi:hypothetical protein
VARFDHEGTLVRWTTEVTTFPSGPDDYPRSIAANSSGAVVVGGMTTPVDGQPWDNRVFAAYLSSEGHRQWRYENDTTMVGGVVHLDELGYVHVGGVSGFSMDTFQFPTVIGLDQWGGERYTAEFGRPRNDADAGGGQVYGFASGSDGSVTVIGSSIVEDELVPHPPLSSASVWERRLDAQGMEQSYTGLWASLQEGTPFPTAMESVPVFGYSGDPEPTRFAHDGPNAFGLAEDGVHTWDAVVSLDPDHTYGRLQVDYLWCASYSNGGTSHALACWYIR